MVPPHIRNLSNLIYLVLDVDSFSNYLWVSDLNWLSGLSSMNYLGLRQLDMSGCELYDLSQSLPFVNFTSLQALDLSYNTFNSSIPQWLFNISTLEQVKLASCNYLLGPIPKVSKGNLCKLRILDVSFNSVDGCIDWVCTGISEWKESIPQWLFNISTLEQVKLASCNYLPGPIPKVSKGNLCKLRILDISFNSVDGEITDFIEALSVSPNRSLETLDLSWNKLIGNLPDSLWMLGNLKSLKLSDNQLKGRLSDSLGSLRNLEELDLSHNILLGPLPKSLWNLSRLEVMDLSFNLLIRTIIESIGQLTRLYRLVSKGNLCKLRILDVSFNSVDGEIIDFIEALSVSPNRSLETLDLSWNKLIWNLPDSLWMLGNLKSLKLPDNQLKRRLSDSLGSLRNLEELDL
ncbi:hypothetical protein REPUB_Repub01dG0073300 [Reevesia pubescens]